jgi:hypothetical protein
MAHTPLEKKPEEQSRRSVIHTHTHASVIKQKKKKKNQKNEE